MRFETHALSSGRHSEALLFSIWISLALVKLSSIHFKSINYDTPCTTPVAPPPLWKIWPKLHSQWEKHSHPNFSQTRKLTLISSPFEKKIALHHTGFFELGKWNFYPHWDFDIDFYPTCGKGFHRGCKTGVYHETVHQSEIMSIQASCLMTVFCLFDASSYLCYQWACTFEKGGRDKV